MNPPTADERASFICDTCQLNHSGTILVAQQIRAAEAVARMEEREACAKLCEKRLQGANGLSDAIRASSEGGAK